MLFGLKQRSDGSMRFDDPTGVGGSVAVPTWTNVNAAGDTVTGADAIFDFQTDVGAAYTGCSSTELNGRRTYQPNGGYYGNGSNYYEPSYNDTYEYLGFRGVGGFNAVGDATRVTMGWLMRMDSLFITDWAVNNCKLAILARAPDDIRYSRPMIIPIDAGLTHPTRACHGIVCSTTDTPDIDRDEYNTGDHVPDLLVMGDMYAWYELQVDCNGPTGLIRSRIWTADGNHLGVGSTMHMNIDGGNGETFGGYIPSLDVMMYLEVASAIGGSPEYRSGFNLDLARVKVGYYGNLTPPPGFPGHVASNWVF